MTDISITSGQNLQNTNITSQTVYISDGGSAYYNTVLNKGSIVVNSNGSSEFLFIQSGTVTVNNSGTAQNNYISRAAQLNVNSGGSTDNNYISSGGTLTVNNEGTANNNYIYSSGILNVNGGSANNTSINIGGTVEIFSGGSAENNYVYGSVGYTSNFPAYLVIYSGGSANNNYISGGGVLNVTNDGFAENNYIYSAGVLNIFSGGSVGITSIAANASMALNSNTSWSEDDFLTITLNSQAQFLVKSGATLHDMTLSNPGSFVIGAGGSANNIIINGGSLYNNNAKTFQNITFGENGGTLGFKGNYLLNQASLLNYSFNNNATLELANGAILSGAVLSEGTLIVNNTGSSIKNIINGGTLILNYSSSWNAGKPNLYGTIFGTNGGTLIIQQDSWNGGDIAQLNGLNSNVNLSFTNGAQLSNININSQHITINTNNNYGSNFTINNGGYMSICNGYGSDFTVNSGGNIFVYQDGRVANVTINTNGLLNLYGAGTVSQVVLNNANLNVILDHENTSESAYINNIKINSGAIVNTTSTFIYNMTLNSGFVHLTSGILSAAVINSNNTLYASNTNLSNITINSNAIVSLTNIKNISHSDSNDITINNGGTLDIINADNAINPLITNTVINSGGIFNISNYNYNVTPIVYSTLISNGGVFNANNTYISDTIILSGGELNVNSGLTVSTTVNSGAILNISNGGSAYITFVSSGAIMNVVSGGVIDQTTIVPEGSLSIGYHGVLLNATINSNASVIIGSGGTLSGVVTLEQGGYIYINTSTGGIINLLNSTSIPTMRSYEDLASNSNDMAKIVISGTGSATTVISGFTGTNPDDSNTITLENINKDDVTQVTYPDADHVTFTLDNGSTITLNVVGIGNYGYELASDPDGNLIFEVCFLAGTMIETPDGLCAVENIQVGDLIMTYDQQTKAKIARFVTWVGHKNKIIDLKHSYNEAEYPIRILKGALADNVPNKDLLLTPEHCLYFDGKFIPVRMLVNGSSILYDISFTQYDYYHIETESHSVIIADGVLTESYLDTGNRHIFNHDQKVIETSFNKEKSWEYDAIAPLTVDRDTVEPIYHNIINRIPKHQLNAKSNILTQDPDLYLITDKGRVITQKKSKTNNKFTFILPADTQAVWIMSRISRPCDVIGAFVDDRRYLGVLVGNVTLQRNGKKHLITTHLDADHLLGWDVKETVPCRWTKGKAFLPLTQLKCRSDKSNLLTLDILSDHSYIIDQSEENNKKQA